MHEYGIYTAADANFFPGVVVQVNALRLHGYLGPLAVFDTGLDPWMRDYLARRGVTVVSMGFLKDVRYTDVLTDETPGVRGWSFKAFGIAHARLFECFTFLDADYIPLCDMQAELHARARGGDFLCTEDGVNTWTDAHADAAGVAPGRYMNANAGFFTASTAHHGAVLEEWRNLMTRLKPFDLWYGDQGALNAILDKYAVPKVLVGDKSEWNQTWQNELLAAPGAVAVESRAPPVLRHRDGRRIYGWHGCGWCRYWHCIGIDHYRTDPAEVAKMRRDCDGKIPAAVLDVFSHLLFLDGDLEVTDSRIGPRTAGPTDLADMYARAYQPLTDKGTAHSYVALYEELLAEYRHRDITVAEIGVWCGGSLLLWAEYFSRATIIGIDANLSHVVPEARGVPRIRLVEGDATHPDLIGRHVEAADVVIDDGSHTLDDQLASAHALVPRLNPGGLYVIEDVWSLDNALRLQQELPGSEIIDRRHVKGRFDDILVVYRKPG